MAVAADIQRLINNAQDRLPGAIPEAIQRELFNTMDEFFKGSNVWNEDLDVQIPAFDPLNTIYELTPTGPSLIDKLLWVYEVNVDEPTERGPGVRASMSIPGELQLASQPSKPVTYRVTVALTVQDPVSRNGYVTFPAWVLAKYRDVILDGLLGKMYSQPNKPYTNQQYAVLFMRKFKQGTVNAHHDWRRNNTYRMQAWAFPRFAGGTQRGHSGWGGPV